MLDCDVIYKLCFYLKISLYSNVKTSILKNSKSRSTFLQDEKGKSSFFAFA